MAKRSNEKRLILVTGATGNQGGAVIRHLREKGFAVRALTRHPDKPEARALIDQTGIEIARGDYDDKPSLLRALEDVYGVFAVQTPFEGGAEAEARQGIAFIDAAHSSEISHFIYSSVGSADQNTGIPHFDSKWKIEEHLRGTGMPYTIVRPVYFMENWLRMKDQIAQGQLKLPLSPETILQQVSVEDIGAFVAMAFEHPGKWHGTATDLAGDELFMDQIAQTLQASYSQIPWADFEKQAGPEMTVMFKWFQNVGYHADITAIRQEMPSLMSFERWRNTNWPAPASSPVSSPQ
ncbi:MAG: NmrA/HSCARG family protein [Acidobacteriota bacterium]|nr:NmrA/HSCARG family protein [Acidobacteriota bacterium]